MPPLDGSWPAPRRINLDDLKFGRNYSGETEREKAARRSRLFSYKEEKAMAQQPIVALLYDFDKTLCTTDMQDYAFIPSLGMTPAEFWAEANDFGRENRMDGILAYMYTMMREAAPGQAALTRRTWWRRAGASCFSPAWRSGSAASTPSAQSQGVEVEHYVISSGLREIIEGCSIAASSRRSTPASSITTRAAAACGPSWRSTSPPRPSSSTASTRACWTCPTTRP